MVKLKKMKILFILVLTFSIFTDFTSASLLEDDLELSCQTLVSCSDSDLHESENNYPNAENDLAHCHCHTGHSHTVVLGHFITVAGPENNRKSLLFPNFLQKGPQTYIADIIRPPIV